MESDGSVNKEFPPFSIQFQLRRRADEDDTKRKRRYQNKTKAEVCQPKGM